MRVFIGAFLLAAATAAVGARVDVEPFFKHADYGEFKLSPSGKHVAGVVPVNGRTGLVAIDVATRKPGHVTTVSVSDIAWFEWVNDDRLVFTIIDRQVGAGAQRGSGLYTVKRDGSEFRVLARPPTIAGQFVYRYTQMLAPLRDGSDVVIVVANDANHRYPDVYRLDTATGKKTLLSLGKPGDVVEWLADRQGRVRVAVTEEPGGKGRTYWRASEDEAWQLVEEFVVHDQRYTPVAFDGDGSLVVATRTQGRDTLALYRFDPAAKKLGDLLAAHPEVDLAGGLVYDRRTDRIVGVSYRGERPGVAWFDEDWARLAASIDRALPGRVNVISRGESPNVLVYSYSDRDPGAYYMLDTEKRKLERLVDTRAGIDPEAMPSRKFVRYPARDGMSIPAWLTLPRGVEAKSLPLVLYVHGGPWVHGSTWHWSDEAAYLASLGYAVIEPAFRGSTGWGYKLFRASFKQWGRAMQDDLDDAMDWAVKQGIADSARACIMGASYGGYAVMMGLARDPARWKCGINYVGVTDINLMFEVTWSDSADSTFMRYSAKERIGDPEKDAEQLRATSPLAQADRIRAPVLMAYGANDRRVPIVHGQKMKDALASRNVPVEWVVYADEGHGFLIQENRFDFYRRVAEFLDKHIGRR
jgi:dipeptidyl aminopeptidase/acylaminoacyl peptidase